MGGGGFRARVLAAAVAAVLIGGGSAAAQVGCTADARQRIAQAGYEGAESASRAAASVFQTPVATLDTCVGDILRGMSRYKALSGGSLDGIVTQILDSLQKQACGLLTQQYQRVAGQSFDPRGFLGGQAAMVSPLVQAISGAAGGGTGAAVPANASAPKASANPAGGTSGGGSGLGVAIQRMFGG
jgi:hypothetical protein